MSRNEHHIVTIRCLSTSYSKAVESKLSKSPMAPVGFTVVGPCTFMKSWVQLCWMSTIYMSRQPLLSSLFLGYLGFRSV